MAVSGAGGYVKFGASTFHVGKWTLTKDPRNVESGDSGQTGTRYTAVKTDPKGRFEFVYNGAATLESVGFVEGAPIATLVLQLGADSKKYTVANSTTGPVEIVDDSNKDVIRGTCEFMGGDVTGPA